MRGECEEMGSKLVWDGDGLEKRDPTRAADLVVTGWRLTRHTSGCQAGPFSSGCATVGYGGTAWTGSWGPEKGYVLYRRSGTYARKHAQSDLTKRAVPGCLGRHGGTSKYLGPSTLFTGHSQASSL